MFRMYASNSHSYTHLILALGIVRKPTIWVFITSKYPGIHDIGLPSIGQARVCYARPFVRLKVSVTYSSLSYETEGETTRDWS